MKILITSIAGVLFTNTAEQMAVLETIKTEALQAWGDAGFKTNMLISVKDGQAALRYGYHCDQPNPPLQAPMAFLDSDKHGKSFIWGKDGVQSNRGKLDWIQRIYMNNIINDILDRHAVVAEIKIQFKPITKTGVMVDGKQTIDSTPGKIMFVRRNMVNGAVREFGKEPGDTSLCSTALFEKGYAPTKLPLRKFKTEKADALAAATVNGDFKAEQFSNDLLVKMLGEDPSVVKFMINNLGGKFLATFGHKLETLDQAMCKYACTVDPRNANYFKSLDVQIVALQEHGLAAIKLLSNPSEFLLGYVSGKWPTYAKVLADLDSIRIQNSHAPACPVIEPKHRVVLTDAEKEAKALAAKAMADKIAAEKAQNKANSDAERIKAQIAKVIAKNAELAAKLAVVETPKAIVVKAVKPVLTEAEKIQAKIAKLNAQLAAASVAKPVIPETPAVPAVPAQVEIPANDDVVEISDDYGDTTAEEIPEVEQVEPVAQVEIPVEAPKAKLAIVETPKADVPAMEAHVEAFAHTATAIASDLVETDSGKPVCDLSKAKNRLDMIGAICKALKKADRKDLIKEFEKKGFACKTDKELLAIAPEYVTVK